MLTEFGDDLSQTTNYVVNLEKNCSIQRGVWIISKKKSESFNFNSFCCTFDGVALWRSWFKQCARSRKVAGSIPFPDGVGIFY